VDISTKVVNKKNIQLRIMFIGGTTNFTLTSFA